MTEAVFEEPGGRAFLLEACETAAEKGNVSFVFDRAEGLRVSSRYRIPAWTGGVVAMPWETRWASIGTVTLNLPRLGYRAERNDERLFSLLTEEVELAAKAQTQKKDFIEKLLAYGDEGPLSFLAMKKDGHSFLRMDQAVYPVGVVGLNELALIHRGSQLHESPEALRFGLKVVTHLRKLVDGLGKKLRMRLILEQTPAESTAYRFARLDLRSFAPDRDGLSAATYPGVGFTTPIPPSSVSKPMYRRWKGLKEKGASIPSSRGRSIRLSGWGKGDPRPRFSRASSKGLSEILRTIKSPFLQISRVVPGA